MWINIGTLSTCAWTSGSTKDTPHFLFASTPLLYIAIVVSPSMRVARQDFEIFFLGLVLGLNTFKYN